MCLWIASKRIKCCIWFDIRNRELQSNEIGGKTSDVVTAEGVVARNEEVNQANKKKKIWNFFLEKKSLSEVTTRRDTLTDVKEDVRLYLSAPLVDSGDPISFWKKYEETMGPLSMTVLKYLCVPATSVPSERVFSKAGQVCTDRRNRLNLKL